MLDRLRTELQEALRHWLPTRRNSKEKLEELARNLPSLLRRPGIVNRVSAASAVVGAAAAPFTFGTSFMVAAAGAAFGAAMGFGASYLSAEAEEKLKLGMVQGAIDMDRSAYADLHRRLDFLKGTFTSSTKISTSDEAATVGTMVGAAVSDVLTRATRFADSSVLPRNITQLVKSSLDRNRGSTSPIVQEIMGILNNLNCPDETQMPFLVESFIAEAKFAEIIFLTST